MVMKVEPLRAAILDAKRATPGSRWRTSAPRAAGSTSRWPRSWRRDG